MLIRDIGLPRHAIENEIDDFENTDLVVEIELFSFLRLKCLLLVIISAVSIVILVKLRISTRNYFLQIAKFARNQPVWIP